MFVDRELVQRTKEDFPMGSRIVLDQMGDDPRPIPPGTKGTVRWVDDMGTVHCDFDNGRRLGLVPGEDSFHLVVELKQENTTEKGASIMEIRVYQVNSDRDDEEIAFMPYIYAEQHGIDPYAYDRVYEGEMEADSLEDVFRLLNTGRFPDGYLGRSLSVSDVCEVITNGRSDFYYCDSVGFKKIDFDPTETQMIKEEEITVVALLPGKIAEIVTIPNNLVALQKFVGNGASDSLIEAFYPWQEAVCLVCNEEGKLNGMQLNRAVYNDDGTMVDIIAGPAFICDCSGEDFGSLTEKQQQRYLQMFHDPEIFIRIGDDIKAIKIQEEQQQKEDSNTQKHHRHQ
jgi:hypothetical protein